MKIKLFFIQLFFAAGLFAQEVSFSDSYDEKDLADALELLGVKVFKYRMPDAYKGYHFNFIVKEYFEGKEINKDNYAVKFENMKQAFLWDKDMSSFIMKIQTVKNDSVETFHVKLPKMSIKNNVLRLKGKRENYSWEPIFLGSKKVMPDKEIPLLAFASYTESGKRADIAAYCEDENHNYRDWYRDLKVKHFFVIITQVTKN